SEFSDVLIDQVLTKRKWTLAFNLCRKESTHQLLLEYLSSDDLQYETAYFIECLNDYNDLFLIENMNVEKANEVWDNAIKSLDETQFSTRQQILEFVICVIYKELNEINEIYRP
ncbi:36864_t:CDS:1, partial [Racocetra persica]